jgi:hypothetical protein
VLHHVWNTPEIDKRATATARGVVMEHIARLDPLQPATLIPLFPFPIHSPPPVHPATDLSNRLVNPYKLCATWTWT